MWSFTNKVWYNFFGETQLMLAGFLYFKKDGNDNDGSRT